MGCLEGQPASTLLACVAHYSSLVGSSQVIFVSFYILERDRANPRLSTCILLRLGFDELRQFFLGGANDLRESPKV